MRSFPFISEFPRGYVIHIHKADCQSLFPQFLPLPFPFLHFPLPPPPPPINLSLSLGFTLLPWRTVDLTAWLLV